MKSPIILFLIFALQIISFGQIKNPGKINSTDYQIHWQKPLIQKMPTSETKKFLTFTGAQYKIDEDLLPSFSQQVTLSPHQNFFVEIINGSYEPLSEEEAILINNSKKITNQIVVTTNIIYVKKQPRGVVNFIPIRKNSNTGKFEKLVSFDLSISKNSSEKSTSRSLHAYAPHSVLQSGKWYKIAVPNDGIYKLSYQFLQSLGMNVTSIDPQNIRVYGNGGGMLPEACITSRADDLVENAISFQGNTNATFDATEYFLFYAKGPNSWTYNNASCPKFKHELNIYADSSYYFITSDMGAGKRIQTQPSTSATVTNTVTTFDDYAFHENDDLNFIKSGRQWFGEYFDNIASYNFSFSFPNIDMSSPATIKANIASKYTGNSTYTINGNVISIAQSTSDIYAITGSTCFSNNPSGPLVTVNITKQTADAIGWLDYVEVNVRRQLSMSGNQMIFRDAQSVGSGNIAQYSIASNTPIQIWDVTDPTNAYSQLSIANNATYQFTLPSDILRQFIAFTGSSYNTPTAIGLIENQDLHGLTNKNLIIIVHPDFYNEAMQLAAYHENTDLITSNVVTTNQIYNEFSSGAQDATALRDFVKMFYDKGADPTELPKYLLLFGDGSYDNKHRFPNNTNYIPTYESVESQSFTGSYVSDDFFACLDDNEGNMTDGIDAVDLGVGRFPVKSKAEAQTALNKIFAYKRTGVPPTLASAANSCSSSTTGSPFGDWRNTLCFIGDDEDGGLHEGATGQGADQLAQMVIDSAKDFNVDKIYFDAYVQVATPGGDRYPDVADAINKRVEKGALIMNYTGHGGEVGLAHERVVEVSQINSWKNINNMPFWVTATCELSRFDDPERTSAGEYIFLNPTGSGIGLLTTTREAFASPNFVINTNFYNVVLTPVNGKMPTLGDVDFYVKNHTNGNNSYGRNFTLLGDPAMTLNYPKLDVSTDTVNTNRVTSNSSDTLKALSRVTVSGFVRDHNHAILTNYNGVLYPTVFDKPQNITTLGNDPTSPIWTFKLQKNVLFKGKVIVTNGYFKFTFIVPKDIAYQYGIGRISYYAENGNEDANGYYEKVIIGGSNASAVADIVGPEVKLYMNDAKFVFGGMTNEKPDLYSILKDENGINTVGNGIGHDITAVLDGNTTNSLVLNDYYQSDLNSYKSGSIRYPFNDLADGKHSLKLKVWDVYNNSSETYTEFIVAKSAELALSHVLNYPNPFTTRTQFYFEQNQCCQTLDVQILIFTISGKLVKTIDQFVSTQGFRSDPIEWDGRDDYGDKIGRGVYIYRVKVKNNDGSSAEKYEKLVILN